MKKLGLFLSLVIIIASLVCSQVFATTALYNQTVRVVDANGNIINSFGGGGGGSPTGSAGGFLGGTYPNPSVSQSAAGAVANNAITVNNSLSNNLGMDEDFEVDPVSSIAGGSPENNMIIWDRIHYHTANLPACPSSDTVIDDSNDVTCNAGDAPVTGTSFFPCKVHCVSGSWKLNGHLNGPVNIASFPIDATNTAFTFGSFFSSPAATIECDGGAGCYAFGLMGATGLVGEFGAGPAVFPNGAVSTVLTVGTLPTCNAGAEGMDREVTDSDTNTWGATCAHTSGTDKVGCHCNGTNWTVYAK